MLNNFLKIEFKSLLSLARCTRCSAPALIASSRQVGHGSHPSATAEWKGNSGEPELTVGDPFRRTERSYVFYSSRRTRCTPMRDRRWIGTSSPLAMAERWRCSPWNRVSGPVEREWKSSEASRCSGERDALGRRRREARWCASHTSSGGIHVGEEGEGEQSLTERCKALGGAFGDGEVEADLEEEGIKEWRTRRGRTTMKELESSNGDDGVVAVRARARWRERERDQVHGREERMASALRRWKAEARSWRRSGHVCRQRGVTAVTRSGARGAAIAASGRRGKAREWGRPGWLRWMGRLVGAGPPVNRPLSPFFKFFFLQRV